MLLAALGYTAEEQTREDMMYSWRDIRSWNRIHGSCLQQRQYLSQRIGPVGSEKAEANLFMGSVFSTVTSSLLRWRANTLSSKSF